jgi:plasmid stability protein
MAQVVIRNLDDDVMRRLKARAAHEHKSLEQALRDILREAAKPTRAEMIERLRRIQAMTPPGTRTPAEDLIREDRDRQ